MPAPALHPESHLTTEQARALALASGFAEAGIVAIPYANENRDAERFTDWVRAGRAGTMRYLEQKTGSGQLIRARIGVPFPWARSALVCFASYGTSPTRSTDAAAVGTGWIARYAWSSRTDEDGTRRPSDYHKVLLKRLRVIEEELKKHFGAFESCAYVDTGPRGGARACHSGRHWMDGQKHLPDQSAAWFVWVSGCTLDLARNWSKRSKSGARCETVAVAVRAAWRPAPPARSLRHTRWMRHAASPI